GKRVPKKALRKFLLDDPGVFRHFNRKELKKFADKHLGKDEEDHIKGPSRELPYLEFCEHFGRYFHLITADKATQQEEYQRQLETDAMFNACEYIWRQVVSRMDHLGDLGGRRMQAESVPLLVT
ncbi:unnamed protein product, partial [Amoebophrya sp. A120]